MKSDIDFARHWVQTLKNLFDLEDDSSDKLLQKPEFDRYISSTSSIMMSSAKCAAATTPEKL